MKRLTSAALAALALAQATPAFAQESGAKVHSIRILATDPEGLAKFYSKAFGMSETERPANDDSFKEIVLNFGSTPEVAKASKSSAIMIATKPGKTPSPPSQMPALVVEVPQMEPAIAAFVAAGGKGGKVETFGVYTYALVDDPEGNPIELLLKR